MGWGAAGLVFLWVIRRGGECSMCGENRKTVNPERLGNFGVHVKCYDAWIAVETNSIV